MKTLARTGFRFPAALIFVVAIGGLSYGDYRIRPVLLVSGMGGNAEDWNEVAEYLASQGVPVKAYSFSSSWADMNILARELGDPTYSAGPLGKSWIQQMKDEYAAEGITVDKIRLVGYSGGALISRRYLTSPYYGQEVELLVTENTPNAGAPITKLIELIEKNDITRETAIWLTVMGSASMLADPVFGAVILQAGVAHYFVYGTVWGILSKAPDWLDVEVASKSVLVQQLKPGSDFLNQIRSGWPGGIQARAIAVGGFRLFGLPATISNESADALKDWPPLDFGTNLPLATVLETTGILIYFAANLTDGDSVVPLDSQKDIGVPLDKLVVRNYGKHERNKEAVLEAIEGAVTLAAITYPPGHWAIGYNADLQKLLIEGEAYDYLPAKVRIEASSSSGTHSEANLDMGTVRPVLDGRAGYAEFDMQLGLTAGGSHSITMTAINPWGNRDSKSYITYVAGTQFPQERSPAKGITSYRWEVRDSGFLGFGAGDLLAEGTGRLTYLDATPGTAPSQVVAIPAGTAGEPLSALYPDGTLNDDVEFLDAQGGLTTTVPSSGTFFEVRLKSSYEGRTFVGVVGNAESKELKEWRLEYSSPAGQAGEGRFIDAGHTIIISAEPVPGPIFRLMAQWDVSKDRQA